MQLEKLLELPIHYLRLRELEQRKGRIIHCGEQLNCILSKLSATDKDKVLAKEAYILGRALTVLSDHTAPPYAWICGIIPGLVEGGIRIAPLSYSRTMLRLMQVERMQRERPRAANWMALLKETIAEVQYIRANLSPFSVFSTQNLREIWKRVGMAYLRNGNPIGIWYVLRIISTW